MTALANTQIAPTADDSRDTLTNTSTGTYDECDRKYYLMYELGIRPEREPEYFRFGGSYHLAHEVYGKTGSTDQAITAVQQKYAVVPRWAENDVEALFDWYIECEVVCRLFLGWQWRWSEDVVEVIATETVFNLPVINPDTGGISTAHRRSGKRDKLVRYHGNIALQEYKTTSEDISSDSDYWRHLRMDAQISNYIHSYQTETILFEGKRLDLGSMNECLYDVVKKPGIRPKKPVKKDLATWPAYFGETITDVDDVPERESVQMYGARLTADIAERPDFYYARKVIPRLKSELDEFQRDFWQKHHKIREAKRLGLWPRRTRACFAMGKCPYFDICANGVSVGDDQPTPPGFIRVANVHTELMAEVH